MAGQGQASARRAVVNRVGELDWTWRELAARARVDENTVLAFKDGRRWPITRTLARISLALGWPAGYLEEVAAGADPAGVVDPDIALVLRSDLPQGTKDRLLDLLRRPDPE